MIFLDMILKLAIRMQYFYLRGTNGEFLIAGECSHKLALSHFADSLAKEDTSILEDSVATFNFEHA